MNQFKYDQQKGELWLDVKRPFAANYDNGEEFDKCLKAWQNRLHYQCSPELKAILKEGQVLREDEFHFFECDLCDGCGWYEGCKVLKTNCTKCGGTGAIAIPLPEQPLSNYKPEIMNKYPDFLPILEENYQAQIAGFYNYDKTDEERKIRNAVIEEYQDLIAIYKSRLISEQPPTEEGQQIVISGGLRPIQTGKQCVKIQKINNEAKTKH